MVIGKYLRLSIADGDLGKDGKNESNSIENQRALLDKYISANPDLEGECVEYIDDGYSGTNFRRPGFIQMIEAAKKGEIQVIVTKDLSRLGRDYIEVGDYLEQIFPVLGIRFIAVNSYYDSNQYLGTTMGLEMSVSNLVNHLYSRDLSVKRKSSLRTLWGKGVETSARPPFGYRLKKDGICCWEIDPTSGKLVRLIFDLALDGWNTRMIMEHMNTAKYPTPSQYRTICGTGGATQFKSPPKENCWTTTMVAGILKRYSYTGAAVHRQREKIRIGSPATRAVPPSQWCVVKNVHPAIVSEDEFRTAQKVLQQSKASEYRIASSFVLKGKVRCGNCRLAMEYRLVKGRRSIYCYHKRIAGETSTCCEDFYPLDDLEKTTLAALRAELTRFHALRNQFLEKKSRLSKERSRVAMQCEKEIEQIKTARIILYESYADGHISREEYARKRAVMEKKLEEMENAQSARRQDETAEEVVEQVAKCFPDIQKDSVSVTLSRRMVDAYIEMVYVYDPKHIEIVFSFEDYLRDIAKYCADEHGSADNVF